MRMMNEVMISPCVVMGSTRLYSRAAIEPVRAQVNHREPLAFHSECVQKEDAQVERRDGNAAKREHTPQVIRDAVL